MFLDLQLPTVVCVAVLSVIGVCSLLYTSNGIASNELFPTCIRNTSYSFGQVASRLGVVIAPQIFILVRELIFTIFFMKVTTVCLGVRLFLWLKF